MTAHLSDAADFLIIGEALIDIVRAPDGMGQESHVGGSPANVALGLARLGHTADLATALGPDDHARAITAHLQDSGVRLCAGSHSLERTATAIATLDRNHAASYEFDIDWVFDPAGLSLPNQHVHTGSIAAYLEPGGSAVTDFVTGLPNSVTRSFDPNIRPSLLGALPGDPLVRERTERLVAAAHVVKASDEDLEFLYPGVPTAQAAATWSRAGDLPRLVVATRGAEGAIAAVAGQVREFEAARVDVVDTVGAGDSFMAGLLSGLADTGLLGTGWPGVGSPEADPPGAGSLSGAALLDRVGPAVERALACAAVTVQRSGADLPRRADLPRQ